MTSCAASENSAEKEPAVVEENNTSPSSTTNTKSQLPKSKEQLAEVDGAEDADSSERETNDDSGSLGSSNNSKPGFRKRRLTLTHSSPQVEEDNEGIKLATAASVAFAEASPDGESKAQTFRKRRLSLTNKQQHEEDDDIQTSSSRSHKRQRRSSEASATSDTSSFTTASVATAASIDGNRKLRSKTLHSDELLAQNPPVSSAVDGSENILYQLRHQLNPGSQQQVQSTSQIDTPMPYLDSRENSLQRQQPKWKRRHLGSNKSEHKLPFPRDIVGTYSCHGIEPIYGDSSDDYDEDEEKQQQQEEWNHLLAEEAEDRLLEAAEQKESAQNGQVHDDNAAIVAKINQDRGGVVFPYGNCRRTALFAVYDGHGTGGELVSQFALYEIQRRLEKHELFSTNLETAFKETFIAVDDSLKEEPLIDPLYAGTTACVAILQDKKLTVANAGDSRAVLARAADRAGSWEATNLTVDQNPDLPAEMERILNSGGYVSPPPGPGLSARVWLDSSCTQIGLAMARSIGDHAVSAAGVIPEPVVTSFDLSPQDEFLILASDGVWEFLSSADAVQLVGEKLHLGSTKACQALIEAAAARWHEEEGEYRDDITAIVVRLQELWDATDDSNNKGNVNRETSTGTKDSQSL